MSRRYATRGSAAWLHLRGRADDRPQGSADTSSGANRFVEELIARVHSDGAISVNGLVVRVDSGFWPNKTIATLQRPGVRFTTTVCHHCNPRQRRVDIAFTTAAEPRRSPNPPTGVYA